VSRELVEDIPSIVGRFPGTSKDSVVRYVKCTNFTRHTVGISLDVKSAVGRSVPDSITAKLNRANEDYFELSFRRFRYERGQIPCSEVGSLRRRAMG
jgi:hypothetical protein